MHRILLSLLCLCGLLSAELVRASQYTFSVGNNTDRDIDSLSASQDGVDWRTIRIQGGIPAHSMTELRWNSKADKNACVWQVKAQFDKGGESEPVEFDFCAADLVLSFTD